MRILFADDDPDVRTLAIRSVLQELPAATPLEATNSTSLAAALADARIDMLVSDYDLRWTDGFEVLAATRSAHPDCSAIMFTGTGDEELAVRAMKAGFDDYLVKSPGQLRRLAASVRLVAERSAERQALQHSRELLRKELYHRLHNNLQIVISLMGQTARVLVDTPSKRLALDVIQRVQSLALLQEQFYRSEDIRHIDIAAFTRAIVETLRRRDGVAVAAAIADVAVPVDKAIPFALIANESLMTARRRMPPADAPPLRVSLSAEDGNVVFRVASPAGRPGDALQDRLGDTLMARLAEQLEARMEDVSEHGMRSVSVTFPA